MSTSEELLSKYQGEIVPRSFRPEFVVPSYIVSWVGAALTLELLNWRTSRNGLFNHLILVSAAVAMGGVSIWCMHFVGNRSMVLNNDEPELRIEYSFSYRALSFFLPIVVLLAAFLAIGANYNVSWKRICCGGILSGVAICGMHYLGNAAISNYNLEYDRVYVAGASLIAIFDSVFSMSLFFMVKASWKNTWWKRVMSACVLAGAVSGMHWAAAIGTSYRLLHLNEGTQLSQMRAILVAVSLAVIAAIFMIGSSTYATWATKRIANKSQQVVLATAVFDNSGRILVNPDGLLPSEKITDTYVERIPGDTFTIAHPIFHWMFQASRNWNSVSGMIDSMTKHLARLPKGGHESKARLIDDGGKPIERYDAIFRESFCLAAANLADKLKEHLIDVGILWDDILATGVDGLPQKTSPNIVRALEEGTYEGVGREFESRLGRQPEYGRGSMMFLVRRLEHSHEADRLESAGFRFADVDQVCGIIGTRMHIKARDLKGKLAHMATFAKQNIMVEPGVHLGFFGVKARVGGFGFDVIVKKGARHLLPSMPISLRRLESWQMDIIHQFDRMSVPLLLQSLDSLRLLSPREMLFASQLSDALQALRAWIDNPIFDDAVLTSKVVQIPCRDGKAGTMIALCLMIPIHISVDSPRCEFIPLNFFKVHQMVYKNSSHLEAFTRYVHRELSPIVNAASISTPQATYRYARRAFRWNRIGSLRHLGRTDTNDYAVVEDNDTMPTKFGRKSSSNDSNHSNQEPVERQIAYEPFDKATAPPLSPLGGIMVSQEIQIDIRQVDDASAGSISTKTADRVTLVKAGIGIDFMEMMGLPGAEEDANSGKPLGLAVAEREKVNQVITFVDELFAFCVDGL
ncbi:hypothetical protein F4818DRAFT_451026 [Hypoxylon cercidicola]|nr:hypothetical protein F4818DRAFT_451026 [Hypoxylon cercidicola]